MNYAQLGQRVKAKYPDYQGMNDEELGRRVAAKYPEYQAQITKEGGGNALTNFLPSLKKNARDIASAAVNVFNPDMEQNTVANLTRLIEGANRKLDQVPVLGTVNRLMPSGLLGTGLSEVAPEYYAASEQMAEGVGQFYRDRYGGTENIKRTVNEDPAGVLLDVSTVLSGGGTAAVKGGQLSRVSALTKAGRAAQTAGAVTDPVNVALKATGQVGRITAKTGGKLSAAALDEAKKLPLQGVRITPPQMQAFEQYVGVPIDEFIKREKLTGNPVEKALENTGKFQKQYDDLVINSGAKVDPGRVVQQLDQRIAELEKGTPDPLTGAIDETSALDFNANSRLVPQLKQARDFYAKKFGLPTLAETGGQTIDYVTGKQMNVSQLVSLRRQLDEYITPKQWLADPDVANLNTNLYRSLNDVIYESVANGKRARELGLKLRDYRKFNEFVAKTNLPVAKSRLRQFIQGGMAAAAITNPGLIPELIGGYAVGRAMTHPRVLSAASTGIEAGVKGARAVASPAKRQLSAIERALRKTNQAARETGLRLLPGERAER